MVIDLFADCLVQQHEHRNLRRCGKGSERHKADTGKPSLAHGGNFVKKSCRGEIYFLNKGLFMGTI